MPATTGDIPMKLIITPQQMLYLKRHALIVLLLCYLPHIAGQPVWLLVTLAASIAYRVVADRFHFPPLAWWVRTLIVILFLFLLGGIPISSSFFISLLLTFIILKCLELNTIRDIKVLILSNFLLIFSALIVSQDLLMVVYMLFALFANLSLMVKISAPEVTLSQISSKSGKQLLIIIPLSIFLFYVFPRLDPLWRIPRTTKVNASLNDKLTPGALSGMFNDEATAMQITFAKKPLKRGYWRGIILTFYNGETWYAADFNKAALKILPSLGIRGAADYEILLEPTNQKFLYYQGFLIASDPSLLFSPDHGLFRERQMIVNSRIVYSGKAAVAPYKSLSLDERRQLTQLPVNANPRLIEWTQNIYDQHHFDTSAFIAYLKNYIRNQPFWYSLSPPPLGYTNNQMDIFWFDTQKGYCEHYASAVTLILRAAGIPARVVLGYYGGQWNPLTQTITIKQNNAHAWLEYWQEGAGWQQLDPTSFIAPSRIDTAIYNRDMALSAQHDYLTLTDIPWRQRISLVMDSLVFYSERWFMFYNQSTQRHLLKNLGLGRIRADQLLQITVTAIPIFFVLIGLYYQWRQRVRLDPLTREYYALQSAFRLLGLDIKSSDTLKQQCDALEKQVPSLATTLRDFIDQYEQSRLMLSNGRAENQKKNVILLFRQLRKVLLAQKSSG